MRNSQILKFALPEFDRGDALKAQITGLRLYWTAQHNPKRGGDVLAPATFEKKLSRGELPVLCRRLESNAH